MTEVLDQSEVDALLSAVSDGEVEQAEDEGFVVFSSSKRRNNEPLNIKTYDFKRPERVSKDQMRAIRTLHETFARNFGAALSGYLRTIVEVQVATTEQFTYAEFIHSLPIPTCFNLLDCEPLEGQIILEISHQIIFPIIDRLLGGKNEDVLVPHRALTQIEERLTAKIIMRANTALSEAWADVTPINFQLNPDNMESNPQIVQIVPPNEVVVVVGFDIAMFGRVGTMNLCIPFNVIEPVMSKLTSQGWASYKQGRYDEDLRHTLVDKLNAAKLEATAILAETTITCDDMVNMKPGDLIITEKPANWPIVLTFEDKKKFLSQLGQHKGNRALRIARPVTPKDRV